MSWLLLWSWIRRYWKWLLFPLGILLYFVGRLSAPRRPLQVVNPEQIGADKVRGRADRKAQEAARAAAAERALEVQNIKARHARVIAALTAAQRKQAKTLQDDPAALNAFLLRVGASIQG